MRKIIEVLRLKFEARLSHERIAAATRISKGAVTKYLRRALEAGITWPLSAQMDEAQLEALLFRHAAPLIERHATPDFARVHQELKRKGVTLMLLWEEYAAVHAGQAYRYSQFCLLYHRFAASLIVLFKLSGTRRAATHPMNSKQRTCEAIQSGNCWLKLASA